MGGKSAGRFSDCHQICQSANVLTEMRGKSAMRVNLPADLVTVTKSASQQICLQKWGGGKCAGRFNDCHQICQKINDCHQICQSANLPGGGKSTSRFSGCQEICHLANLLAEMGGGVNLGISASFEQTFLVRLAGEWIQRSSHERPIIR